MRHLKSNNSNVLNKINECKIIDLPKIHDPRGNLSFIQECDHIPFSIKGAYWIYNLQGDKIRRPNNFRKKYEMIIALSGSLDINVSDGINKKTFTLNRSYLGLCIPPGVSSQLHNFSTNSLILVLSSIENSIEEYGTGDLKTQKNSHNNENKY